MSERIGISRVTIVDEPDDGELIELSGEELVSHIEGGCGMCIGCGQLDEPHYHDSEKCPPEKHEEMKKCKHTKVMTFEAPFAGTVQVCFDCVRANRLGESLTHDHVGWVKMDDEGSAYPCSKNDDGALEIFIEKD